jgi:hypothetical protein
MKWLHTTRRKSDQLRTKAWVHACLAAFPFRPPAASLPASYTFARKESEPRKKVETLTGCVAFEILLHCDKHDGSPGGGRVEKSRGADRRGWVFRFVRSHFVRTQLFVGRVMYTRSGANKRPQKTVTALCPQSGSSSGKNFVLGAPHVENFEKQYEKKTIRTGWKWDWSGVPSPRP